MKKNMLFGALVLVAGSLVAADSGPKDDVSAAAKKLADASNYSWTSKMDLGPNSQFTPGPTEGKTEKDGITWLSISFNDNTSEGAMKGSKVVAKGEEGWQTAEEITGGGGGGGGGFNPGMMIVRRMQTLKTPSAEVDDLLSKVKEIKKDGDVYSADMTEDGAKSMLTMGFGGRRGGGGGQAPQPTNAKGSVKFWVKDGALTKYETKVSGKRQNRNGDEVEIERTTTTDVKDVGTTKISLPDEAKKKLS